MKLPLAQLEQKGGPEPYISLYWLVWQLCDLWQRETGKKVTSNAVVKGGYTSKPQSQAGKWVVAAVKALLPSQRWREDHERWGIPIRARIFDEACRDRAVHLAMRQYVAAHPPPEPRRGRPKQRPKQRE
ncbi:MAG: hypothetical protein WA020_03030 [Candidatus Acidiferrales bacterium]